MSTKQGSGPGHAPKTLGKLAEVEGWSTATVVTSRFHARRVGTMFGQCTSIDATVIYQEHLNGKRLTRQVFHEIGGYIKFWLTDPC